MADDPWWAEDDPEPGDFDEDLEAIDPQFVEHHASDPTARFRLVRAAGERIISERAEALKRLADHNLDADAAAEGLLPCG